MHKYIILLTLFLSDSAFAIFIAPASYNFECSVSGTLAYGEPNPHYPGFSNYKQTTFSTKKRRIYINPNNGSYSDSNIFLPIFQNGIQLDNSRAGSLNEEFGFRVLISYDHANNLFFFSFKTASELGHTNSTTRFESVSNFHAYDKKYTTTLSGPPYWLNTHRHESSYLRAKLECEKTEY